MIHQQLGKIVEFLVSPEAMKGKGAWPREIKMLKRITGDGTRYDDYEFWMSLSYPQYFWSLNVFVKPNSEYAEDLERKWRFYQAEKERQAELVAQKPNFTIDDAAKTRIVMPRRKKGGLIGFADNPAS